MALNQWTSAFLYCHVIKVLLNSLQAGHRSWYFILVFNFEEFLSLAFFVWVILFLLQSTTLCFKIESVWNLFENLFLTIDRRGILKFRKIHGAQIFWQSNFLTIKFSNNLKNFASKDFRSLWNLCDNLFLELERENALRKNANFASRKNMYQGKSAKVF